MAFHGLSRRAELSPEVWSWFGWGICAPAPALVPAKAQNPKDLVFFPPLCAPCGLLLQGCRWQEVMVVPWPPVARRDGSRLIPERGAGVGGSCSPQAQRIWCFALPSAGCFCGAAHVGASLAWFAARRGVSWCPRGAIAGRLRCPQPAPTPRCRSCSTQTPPKGAELFFLPLLRSRTVNFMHLGHCLAAPALKARLKWSLDLVVALEMISLEMIKLRH